MPTQQKPPPASPTNTDTDPLRPVVLVIFDGFGLSPLSEGNPIAQARKPNLDYIIQNFPGAALAASGISVGLVWGEFGNSEVGHRALGGGVVLYQNLPRISLAIENGSFFKKEAFIKAAKHVQKNNSALHIMGLLGNGGIHAHTDHLIAMIRFAAEQNLEKVYIHLFTDGIDVPSRSSLIFLDELQEALTKYAPAKIATVIGRDFAMDRDGHWPKTEQTYRAMTEGKGATTRSARDAITAAHKKGIGDEKIEPTVITENGQPIGLVSEGDALVYINFRNDRERQLTEAFALPSLDGFDRGDAIKDLFFVTMVQYEEALPVEIAFAPEHVEFPIARIISEAGQKQLHVAESDKYAHVTFFFNGGAEKAFPGEKRILVPSKNVSSYDKVPEMSAAEITKEVVKGIESNNYGFIVANYANSDLVGHTGNLAAGIKAIETLDKEIGILTEKILQTNGALLITSDHGNSEEMINAVTNEVDKQHSTNAVPFYLVASRFRLPQPKSQDLVMQYYDPPAGVIADVTPTVLELMGLPKHPDMTGISLLNIVQ